MASGPTFKHDEPVEASKRREVGAAGKADAAPGASFLLHLQRLAGNRALADLLRPETGWRGMDVQRKCIPGHLGPARSHGVSMNALSAKWGASGMQTKLILSYQGVEGAESTMPLASTTSTQSVAHGAEHAEDVALRAIRDNITMFKPAPDVNRLWMSVTKSPCTSVARNGLPITSSKVLGCTESLIDLVTNGVASGGQTYNFQLTVHVYGLYAPQVPGYTQADVLDASQAALDELGATPGITVTGDVRTGAQARFGAK